MHITLIGLNARYTHSCLALFYVRNELESHCEEIQIDIEQFTINDPYYELLLCLTEKQSDSYFFSAAIWNSEVVIKLINDLRLLFPGSCFVVGGPQAEIVGKSVGGKGCTVVVGEIERVDNGFYVDLQKRSLKSRYVGEAVNRHFGSPYRSTDFELHLQNRHIYYETSRGCPFSCTYCLSAAQKGVFHKDLDLVTSELFDILHFKPGVVRFVDRTFNDNPGRALALWRFLAELEGDTVFHFEISPERFTEEMFALLEQLPPGKFQFEIGIQSTNRETLKGVRRPIDTAQAHEVITRLGDMHNIHLHVDLILGLPYETQETFLRSFEQVFSMRPHYIQMGLLKVLPDTPICHTAPEFGYIYSQAPPYSVFSNNWMDHQTLQNLYWFSECVERFLNNRYFVSLWKYFRNSSVNIVDFFLELLEICHKELFFKRAPTQVLLCQMILACVKSREDENYIRELLTYDWLRCGHRFLPKELELSGVGQSRELKKKLFHLLAQQDSKIYSEAEKKYFLKKGFFLEFSGKFIIDLGLESTEGVDGVEGEHYLCFLPDRNTSLYHFNKVVHFAVPSKICN